MKGTGSDLVFTGLFEVRGQQKLYIFVITYL